MLDVYGFLRSYELDAFTWEDMVFSDGRIIAHVHRKKKKGVKRSFKFIVEGSGVDVINKYKSLHQPEQLTGKFLKRIIVAKKSGVKYIGQNIGKNTHSNFATMIAAYLGFTNSKDFTGHSWRRTGATILAETGVSAVVLQRAGGWSSSSVAEGYVDDSLPARLEISSRLQLGVQKQQEAAIPDSEFHKETGQKRKLIAFPLPDDDHDPDDNNNSKSICTDNQEKSSICQSSHIMQSVCNPFSSALTPNHPVNETVTMNNASNCTINLYFGKQSSKDEYSSWDKAGETVKEIPSSFNQNYYRVLPSSLNDLAKTSITTYSNAYGRSRQHGVDRQKFFEDASDEAYYLTQISNVADML